MGQIGWRVRHGRELHRGPRWDEDEAILVFDRASGDYWVLSAEADRLLRSVDSRDPSSPAVQDTTACGDLLAELERCGLICPVGCATIGVWPSAEPHLD